MGKRLCYSDEQEVFFRAWCGSVIEHLLSMHEALGSTFSPVICGKQGLSVHPLLTFDLDSSVEYICLGLCPCELFFLNL